MEENRLQIINIWCKAQAKVNKLQYDNQGDSNAVSEHLFSVKKVYVNLNHYGYCNINRPVHFTGYDLSILFHAKNFYSGEIHPER